MSQFHLYAAKSGSSYHLGRKNVSNARHLVCGRNILAPSDYLAYLVGKDYNSDMQPASGYYMTIGPAGGSKRNIAVDCIRDARNNLLNDIGGYRKGYYMPHFYSTSGTLAMGCLQSNDLNAVRLTCGCFIFVPLKKFVKAENKTVTGARVVIKGYSDRMVASNKVGLGIGSFSSWSYPFKSYLKNYSISGTRYTPYNYNDYSGAKSDNQTYGFTSKSPEMVLANCHWDYTQLKARLGFYTRSAHGNTDHGTWIAYDTMMDGIDPACMTQTSMQYYLDGMIDANTNPTFAGLVGTNAHPNGASTYNYDHAFPLLDANTGTVTHENTDIIGDDWGQCFGSYGGTIIKTKGSNWYSDDELDSTAKADSTWNVDAEIELPPHHINWFNQYGYIWVMVTMPCPFFSDNTQADPYNGCCRHVYIEDYRLEVDYL